GGRRRTGERPAGGRQRGRGIELGGGDEGIGGRGPGRHDRQSRRPRGDRGDAREKRGDFVTRHEERQRRRDIRRIGGRPISPVWKRRALYESLGEASHMWPVDTRVEAEEPDGHLHGASNADERRTQLPRSRFHPARQIDDDRAERKRYDRLGIHQRYDDVVVNGLAAERASQRAGDGTDDEDEIVNTLSDDR